MNTEDLKKEILAELKNDFKNLVKDNSNVILNDIRKTIKKQEETLPIFYNIYYKIWGVSAAF